MKTNEKADINAGWQPNGKVKPAHINALTGSIQYDYVITDRMLENKSGEVAVNDLFQSGAISGRSGEFHVLVNSVVPAAITLVFDAGNAGGQDPLNVHVHGIAAFKAKVTGSDDHVTYYFHTHGTANPVTLYGVGKHTYVGSFSTGASITLASGATFVYENALNGVSAITGTTTQSLWLTNASSHIKPDWNAAAGSDAEILNKPVIPTVNNGTLTIQKNGSNVATFSANQSTAATANITVPTKTSELNNDAGFITDASLPTVNNGTLTIRRNGTSVGTFSANQSSNNRIDIAIPRINLGGGDLRDDFTVGFGAGTGVGIKVEVEEDVGDPHADVSMTYKISPEPTSADAGKMFSVDSNGSTCWANVPTEVLYVDQANPPQIAQIVAALNAGKMAYTIVTYDGKKYLLPFKCIVSTGQSGTVEFADIIDVENHGVTELYWRVGGSVAIRRHTESLTPLTPEWISNTGLSVEEGKFYVLNLNNQSAVLTVAAAMDANTGKPLYDYPVHTILEVGVSGQWTECSQFTLRWTDEAKELRELHIAPERTPYLDRIYSYAFDITVQAFETSPGSGQYWHAARVHDYPCFFRDRDEIGDANNALNAMIGLTDRGT